MKIDLKNILTLLLILGSFSASRAQTRISLLTIDPGKEIYELDGHTALRFQSPMGDYVVNWGVFDFNSPNFLYRFVKGETDYMAWPFDFNIFMAEYRGQGRQVTEQVLNLTPEQAARLEALVHRNLLPENRTYRYNYIYDNCATRPLVLAESAIGDSIRLVAPEGFTYGETGIRETPGMKHTFRTEMHRTHADYPWYQFGIDLALGSGLDREVSPRLRTYSPIYLRDALRNAYITDSAGVRTPIILSSEIILPSRERVTDPATPLLLTPMAVAIYILATTLLICLRDLRRRKITRWFDSVIFSIYFLMGLVITFLVFVSVHEATSPNYLLLWLNPFCIIPAVFIWIKSCKRAVYCYHFCNFAALLMLLLVGLFSIQDLNSAFYLLIVGDMALSARYILIENKR